MPQLDPTEAAARVLAGSGAEPSRHELKQQISALEARLSAHAAPSAAKRTAARPRLLTTEELATVRDELVARVEQLDAMRDDLVGLLASVRMAMGEEPAPRTPSAPAGATSPQPAPTG